MRISARTKILGVFGDPVGHSLSPVMHNAAIEALGIDYLYLPFHVTSEGLPGAIAGVRAMEFAGVNCTIPHKEAVGALLDDVSESAKILESVNTVINRGGKLFGDSTDGPGFLRSVEEHWGKIDGCRALVLGAGGSSKAVCFALAGQGCKIRIANRTFARGAELANKLNSICGGGTADVVELSPESLERTVHGTDILVNTTSVGMWPKETVTPIEKSYIRNHLLIYDLVYSPNPTRLVAEAREVGAKAECGLGMLVWQGALSFEMWTSCPAPVTIMRDSLVNALAT